MGFGNFQQSLMETDIENWVAKLAGANREEDVESRPNPMKKPDWLRRHRRFHN